MIYQASHQDKSAMVDPGIRIGMGNLYAFQLQSEKLSGGMYAALAFAAIELMLSFSSMVSGFLLDYSKPAFVSLSDRTLRLLIKLLAQIRECSTLSGISTRHVSWER
jgi:hypothetical protein